MADPIREAYPLYWPDGWKRTPVHQRRNSRYEVNFSRSRNELLHELHLLGARRVVLSTNVPLRRDGLPYADWREPDDSGVAVWWADKKGRERVMACDQWRLVRENIRSIGLTVEALRQIERAGASDLLERAFTGFAALPAAIQVQRPWRDVLGFNGVTVTKAEIEQRYRTLAKERHPDVGGSHDAMSELNYAKEQALQEVVGG